MIEQLRIGIRKWNEHSLTAPRWKSYRDLRQHLLAMHHRVHTEVKTGLGLPHVSWVE